MRRVPERHVRERIPVPNAAPTDVGGSDVAAGLCLVPASTSPSFSSSLSSELQRQPVADR